MHASGRSESVGELYDAISERDAGDAYGDDAGNFGAFVGTPTACTGTGNTCQFTITASETVTATFTPGPGMFPLTVVAGTPHTGGGTITSAPTGINCTLTGTTTSGTCTQNFPAGTMVTMTSAPGPRVGFLRMVGDDADLLERVAA